MAEPDPLKKETVRIELPLPPVTKPPEPIVKPYDTVRIQLPVRETGNTSIPASSSSGPKEETVRIALASEPFHSSEEKTQPLIAVSQVARQNSPIAMAPAEKKSMLLYWILLGVSALILIIQIWIYFS
jgi:hypothetical protein